MCLSFAELASADGWRSWPFPDLPLIVDADNLLAPLLLCDRSLRETGNAVIAGGRLLDLIRRVRTFGVTIVRLDIRQDPEGMLKKLCETIGLDWDPGMLSWPRGPKPFDGAWAPHWMNIAFELRYLDDPLSHWGGAPGSVPDSTQSNRNTSCKPTRCAS